MSAPRMEGPFRVYVGLVPQGYLQAESLGAVIREGIHFCQLNHKLTGKVVIRPDLAGADESFSPYCYTNPQVVRETLQILAGPPFYREDVLVAAQTQGLFRTSHALLQAHGGLQAFKSRGYYGLSTLFPQAKIEPIEDGPLLRYLLGKDGVVGGESGASTDPRSRYWSELLGSRHFFDANCLIYAPKIRSSLITGGFSGALKLGGMGNLVFDQAGRGQDRHNDRRIVDMLEVACPDIVIGDGVIIPYGGHELTAPAHELGVILVANNPVAHDLVAAQVLGVDPQSIGHLKIAMARGWGPTDLSKILLGGAGSDGLRMLQGKTALWTKPPQTLRAFIEAFEATDPARPFPIEVLDGGEFEPSGVHGAFLSWLYLNYDVTGRRAAMARWPKATVVLSPTTQLPKHRRVYVLGDRAMAEFKKNIVETRFSFPWGARQFMSVRLRNGRRYSVVFQPGSPPLERDLCLTFLMGSKLRIRTGMLRLALPQGNTSVKLERKAAVARATVPLASTLEMKRNEWWARR